LSIIYLLIKVITDKTKSLFSAIMAHTGAFNRYHTMLADDSPEYVDLESPAGRQLLQHSSFIDPSLPQQHQHQQPVADNNHSSSSSSSAAVPFASTTIIFVPASTQGFSAASTALKWLSSSSERASPQRLTIVLDVTVVDQSSYVTVDADGIGVLSDISSSSSSSPAPSSSATAVVTVASFLFRLQTLLSHTYNVSITGSTSTSKSTAAEGREYAYISCASSCVEVLQKVRYC
jgi:hypothetical protein